MVYTSARMKEKNRRLFWFAFLIFSVAAAVPSVYGGERTVPVDLFILVDKSLSMGESEKFPGVLAWTEEQLTGQMLVEGDWLTLYQFYGESENLLTTTIRDDSDRETVRRAFTVIRPDGRFTDIGLALDTIKEALDSRKDNGRYKIMILLTDLKQEAPWTSKYPGVIDPFESPYLAEARMVDHGGWYEITLDMDIHDTVVTVSRDLFREIAALGEAEREIEPETETDFVRTQNPQTAPGGEPAAGESGAADSGRQADGTGLPEDSSGGNSGQHRKIGYTAGGTGVARAIDRDSPVPEEPEKERAGGFPLLPVLCGAVLLILLLFVFLFIRSRKPQDETKKPGEGLDLSDLPGRDR